MRFPHRVVLSTPIARQPPVRTFIDRRIALKVKIQGKQVLTDPLWNKGMAFPFEERERLALRGLLPPRQVSMELQIKRFLAGLAELDDDVQRAMALNELHDRNETLFHRVLVDNIEELAPLVYTPTVGRVCQEFGDRFRRPRGMYFSTADRGCFNAMLYNWPNREPHVCVVTDGSRILGLGDLGAHGMGIPIGKLALYCAAGGIPPHRVLPVMLDCGTDNPRLLKDPYYLGTQHPRLQGDEYYAMVDEFMAAMKYHFPHCLVQFEDFSTNNASQILERYRHSTLCFNDDIQGTGCVALAGILSALRSRGLPPEALQDQRFLVAGAGSAGIGVADMLVEGMVQQGLPRDQARARFYICDQFGLLGAARRDELDEKQRLYARTDLSDGLSLMDCMQQSKPTVLLGLSAVGGLFQEDLIREMAAGCERPIIFPLSNPTTAAECTAAQAVEWTDGRVVFGSGSPFDPVEYHGRTVIPSQCNNMFIFPGLGLGATVSGAKRITERTLYDVSIALSDALTEAERERGQVFPSVGRIRDVSEKVALAAMLSAQQEGLDTKIGSKDPLSLLQSKTYEPVYCPLGRDPYA